MGLIVASVGFVGVRFGWPILAIIGALVVSIVLHEAGHYLVAKWTGMKVTEFFIGFGPPLWSFTRGETTYGIKPILAGAYVRIIGMSNLEKVDPIDEDRSYRSKPYFKRLAVVVAGPFANFVIAFVLLVALFAGFGTTRAGSWEVDRVVEGSTAAEIGLQPGDQILEVGGEEITDWASFQNAVAQVPAGPLAIAYERGGERHEVITDLGWRLGPEAAAALPLLEEGDEIASVGGQQVTSYESFAEALANQPEGTVEVVLRRSVGETIAEYRTDLMVPVQLPEAGGSAFVGVGPADRMERFGPVRAVGEAGAVFGDTVVKSVQGIVNFFSPSGLSRYASLVIDTITSSDPAVEEVPTGAQLQPVSPDAPPVANNGSGGGANEDRVLSILGVVRLGSQAAEFHISALLWIVIIVNIFLGLLNLIPLPPFDGGWAAIATYEAVRGRLRGRSYRVDMAKIMPVAYAVILLLVGIGVSSMYLDVVNPVESPFGR